MFSFHECLVFFDMCFDMDFDMFFGILVFQPKSGFCMGYSLCKTADFQNVLISRMFGVF